MFDKTLRNIIINTYFYLKDTLNIVGKARKKFINENFNCHITSVYNWMIECSITKNKNINVNPIIEHLVYKCVNELKMSSLKKIKKYIHLNIPNSKNISFKLINYILKINNLKCENYKINKEINSFIVNTMNENKITTSKELINIIFNKFNITISETSIYNILKKNKITYKKIKVKTNPYTDDEQKERLINTKYIIDNLDINNIISYDEISAVTNETPKYGWSKKGSECILKNKNKSIYGERYTIGMAVDTKNIVGFKIVKKGLKTDDFIDFMQKLKNKDPENKKSYFIDNASIHHSKKFFSLTRENKMHILFNAPYNSEKNPIEYFFSLLRKEIERNVFNNIEELTLLVNNFKNKINNNCLENIFKHAFNLFNVNY